MNQNNQDVVAADFLAGAPEPEKAQAAIRLD
jgi:hypothetical protein